MPAVLDEPANPPITRAAHHDGDPAASASAAAVPFSAPAPRLVTLRDRVTGATVIPLSSQHQVPASLCAYLAEQMNREIENGDTYPFLEPMSAERFAAYWFQDFGAVMLLGDVRSPEQLLLEHGAAGDRHVGRDFWAALCLGSFYIRPNYPGRASHVCSAGFLVTDAARNKGVGRLMGEAYLDWAPRLGYSYSVFNLVFETNVASCKIWDALGFKRIGRVKGAGSLKSYPGQLIDAIIYGRDLGTDETDLVNEERFDKIKFYLKYGTYPTGADRAEKSRLRSAATHYKLVDNDKLMLKDKEVIADPKEQYEIARTAHVAQHGGINKTTATIALKYHWVRIKETVSQVIKNCAECKELGKLNSSRPDPGHARSPHDKLPVLVGEDASIAAMLQTSVAPHALTRTLPVPHAEQRLYHHQTMLATGPSDPDTTHTQGTIVSAPYMPLDPQMMLTGGSYPPHHHAHPHHMEQLSPPDHEQDGDSFQAMLNDGPRRDSVTEMDMLIDAPEDVDSEVARRDDGLRGGLAGLLNDDDEVFRRRQMDEAQRMASEAMRIDEHG